MEDIERQRREEREYFRQEYQNWNSKNKTPRKFINKLKKQSEKLSDILTDDEILGSLVYGLYIFTYEAASIAYCNIGIEPTYRTKRGFFPNSLLSDFLKENGLKSYRANRIKSLYEFEEDREKNENSDNWNNGSEDEILETFFYEWDEDPRGDCTRDIICITFNENFKSIDKRLLELQRKIDENSSYDELKIKLENEYTNNKISQKKYKKRLEQLEQIKKSYEIEYINAKDENEQDFKEKKKTQEKYKESKIRIEDKYNKAKEAEKKRKEHFEKLLKYANEKSKDLTEEQKKLEKSALDLRTDFYDNGIVIKYPDAKIKYKRFYRSASKAKQGSCMFIREELYDLAIKYLRMGDKSLLKENKKLVQIEAYQSLVASTIIGKVKINPKNILVIKDVVTNFDRPVISAKGLIEGIEHNNCEKKNDVLDKWKTSTLWDGQSLIDISTFEKSFFYTEDDKLEGFILLRNHFFKSCAFATDIYQFFSDYCDEHKIPLETFVVKDLWGQEHLAKEIQLITTENSLKFLKFGEGDVKDKFTSYEKWCKNVDKFDSLFGIVKTGHFSKYDDYVRTSYQMVNVLKNDENTLEQVLNGSRNYLNEFKNTDKYIKDPSKDITKSNFYKYLEQNAGYENDYEVLSAIIAKNRNFLTCDYLRKHKNDITNEITKNVKAGKLLIKGSNLTLVGSPYAMLLAAANENIEENSKLDTMFSLETGDSVAIQCYSQYFDDKEIEIGAFRSPFNAQNNLLYLRNIEVDKKIKRYFRYFGKTVLAVNVIGTDIECRGNGLDFDSDFCLCTTQEDVVTCAREFYNNNCYQTIINDIEEEKGKGNQDNTIAKIDQKLSESQKYIGLTSNLAQLALSYSYNLTDKTTPTKQRMEDIVALLGVLAQICVDSAKKSYKVEFDELLIKIKDLMHLKDNKYPVFWEIVDKKSIKKHKSAKEKTKNINLKCPMNYVYNKEKITDRANLDYLDNSIGDYLNLDIDSFKSHTMDREIEAYIKDYVKKHKHSFTKDDTSEEESDEYLLLSADYKEMVKKIKRRNLKKDTFLRLLGRAFEISTNGQKLDLERNKSYMLKILYEINPKWVLECFISENDWDKNLLKERFPSKKGNK